MGIPPWSTANTWPRHAAVGWLAAFLLLSCLTDLHLLADSPGPAADSGYQLDTWEVEDGLPENSATAMARTPDGYLWFGTFNGLVRFDGAKFTVYHPGNTPQLPSAGIVNIHADRSGRLWISTYTGLVLMEGSNWRRVRDEDGWAGDYARTFADRANGDLLITSFNGKVFEHSGGELAQLPAPPGEPGQGYFGGVDEAGRWWLAQNRFIGYWENDQWVKAIDTPEVAADAVALGPARDGGLWLALGAELRKLQNGVEVRRITMTEHSGGIWSLSEDREGNIWFASHDRGFCRVTPDGALQRWNSTNGAADSGRFVFEDIEGNLWAGTSGGGLLRFKPRRFQIFAPVDGTKRAPVKSVWPDGEGGVLAGTYGRGVFRVRNMSVSEVSVLPTGGSPAYVQSLLVDRAGDLWTGTYGDALWRKGREGVEHFSGAEIGHNILALFEDSRKRVWIGGGSRIGLHEAGELQTFGKEHGLPETGVRCFAEDHRGAIWVATGSGVFRRESERFVEVLAANGESFRSVTSLKADPDGTMWLGSRTDDLIHWQNGRSTPIGSPAGLSVNDVHGIIEDRLGYFWLATDQGVLRVARRSLEDFVGGRIPRIQGALLDRSDGLPTLEFSPARQPNCAMDERGRLWFATTKSVAMIDPAEFRANELAPTLLLEEVVYHTPAKSRTVAADDGTVGERYVETRLTGPFGTTVTLPPGSRRMEMHYTGLNFSAPEKVRFQTKLDGVDAEWLDAGAQRMAYYYELPSGDYTFRVRAANNDGVWNEAGVGLAFTVLPNYWQTTWFRIAVALGLLAAGGGAVGFWTRHRLHRAWEREQVAHEIRDLAGRLINAQEGERMRLARELHDDFSQSLALLSVELEMFGRQSDPPPDELNNRMQEFSAQVKELSSDVHRVSHELHPAKLEQLGLAAAVRGFCKELSVAHQIAVRFEPGEMPPFLPNHFALCLYRVVQEALQNVVKHSHATGATVRLDFRDGEVRLQIVDDGDGFDPATVQRGGSLGLVSMRERVRLVNGTLTVESKPGAGTRVEVRLMVPSK